MENRNIYLFASGKAVSILGSSIFSFAIGLYVLKLTGSALNYAMTLMLSVIPMVVISPIAGVIADRVSKKWLVSGMDFINSILFAALFILSIYRELTLPVIYIAIVLLNVFTTFFGIGIETAKPALVSSEKLIRINSLSKLIDSSATVLGPVIGGVVYAFVDIRALILFSSIAFMISAVSEWFIDYEFNLERRLYENHEKSEENKSILSDIIEGWKFFSGNRSLLQLFFLFFMLNMLIGFSVNVPLPYIINEVLRFSSSRFGMINSMFPIGLIIGTLTVEYVMKRIEFRKLLILMNILISIMASVIGLPVILGLDSGMSLAFYCIVNIIIGIAIAYVDVPVMTILQNEVPRELLGRVLSLIMSLVKAMLPVALLCSGALTSRMPVQLIPAAGAVIPFIYSIFMLKKNSTERLLNKETDCISI
ncbi:MAG: MFS transporter [Clostridia bacterium]|nr:MFS transporter [Clostridia bacterium]